MAATLAVRSAMTGQLWPTLGLAGASAAFGAAASALNCNHNPGPPPGGEPERCDITGGWGSTGVDVYRAEITADAVSQSTCAVARTVVLPKGFKARVTGQVTSVEYIAGSPGPCGSVSGAKVRVNMSDRPSVEVVIADSSPTEGVWRYHGNVKAVLESPSGPVVGSPPDCGNPMPSDPDVYQFIHHDAATNCSYTYKLRDSWIASDGLPRLAWEVSGASQQALAGNCQGGRITGYVWAPSPPDRRPFNPDLFLPGPDGGGPNGWSFSPDWGGIVNAILRVMEFNDPGDLYRLVSACEVDAGGEPISRAIEVNIPPGVRDNGASTRVRLAAIVELLQGLKDFKQPICPPVKPQLTGEWVTVNFLSDAPSDQGERRLRKVFRYRDQNFAPQEDHIAHWENFTWESGPVIVVSKNLPWGTPKVWAASADEGKRVIEHAAQVAGVDLSDPKHQWIVTHSGDPRYGRPGRMRVDTRGGNFIRVTKRPGPSGLPVGATAHS